MGRLHTIWTHIRHHKYLVTIFFFVLLLGFLGENSVWSLYQRNCEIQALEVEKQGYIDQYNHDTEELNDLLNNPDAAERVARERYHMKRPDEDVFVVLSHKDKTESADTLNTSTDASAQ